MMILPAVRENLICLMGIDPGTNTMGVARIDIDPKSLEIINTVALTYQADRMFKYDEYTLEDSIMMRYQRLQWHERNLYQLFIDNEPYRLTVESNYINLRNPNAYGPLVESVSAIRRAYYNYDSLRKIYLIDPTTVKKTVGAPTRGTKDGFKEPVKQALKKIAGFLKLREDYLDSLDEHSIDAIAITFWQYTQLYNQVMHERLSIL